MLDRAGVCGVRRWQAAILAALLVSAGAARAEEDASAVERRLAEGVGYLASDELEGRGVGTAGLDKAADYLAEQFKALGLKTELFDGSPFQAFTMTVGAELGPENRAALVGPATAEGTEGQRIELKLGEAFTPLSSGGSGQFDLPLVFVGYGITAGDEMYDDYAGIDVQGKAVVILRKEPQQANPHSAFNGTDPSQHATFMRKLSNAYEHGAAAVVFVQDEHGIREAVAARRKLWDEALDKLNAERDRFRQIAEPTLAQLEEHRKAVDELAVQVRALGEQIKSEFDPLLAFQATGGDDASGRPMPVMSVRRTELDEAVKAALGKDLTTIEREIDAGPAPQSATLGAWRIVGQTDVKRTEAHVKNVAAVLEGEGPLAEETVVIGAHYDHLGWGGPGSFVPDAKEIHNGADDNGSGAAALVEVARRLVESGQKPRRRIVFIAFTAEERGLIGSAHYIRQPLYPPEATVAMLNMDMVGRLTDEKLIIQGVDTADEFGPLVEELNKQYGFQITQQSGGFGPSDHSSFYGKQIPVMHFFTGTHADYHRPSDDADKLNVPGMRRMAGMVADAALALANAEGRPTYKEVAPARVAGGGGDRPYFGSIPDFSQSEPGYALMGVTKDGPAEKAGIQGGDIIVQLGESRIGNLEDFDSALRKFKAGDKVPVTVKRAGEELTLEVTLDPPR